MFRKIENTFLGTISWGRRESVLLVVKPEEFTNMDAFYLLNMFHSSENAMLIRITTDRRLSAKFVPTFVDRWCRMVSATDPYSYILGFLNPRRYYLFQVAFQLYSRG
jgi:hypothetical protein